MPSHTVLKTYERSNKNKSTVTTIFPRIGTKKRRIRKKRKSFKIPELPPREEALLMDDSLLKVSTEDTFDKLLKEENYNSVKTGEIINKFSSSESDLSKSNKSKITHITTFHSPIMTRSKRRQRDKQIIITEIEEKSSTLEKPITSSLSIEVEVKKPNFSSLSYIKLPKIREHQIMDVSHDEFSFGPIFSDTFKERQAVHSSTPCVTVLKDKIIQDPISPIVKGTSSDIIETSVNTPQLMRRTRAKCIFPPDVQDDWKLHCQPKVHIQPRDIINMNFIGFDEIEQNLSSQMSEKILEEVSLSELNFSKILPSTINFITTRRRWKFKSTSTPVAAKRESVVDLTEDTPIKQQPDLCHDHSYSNTSQVQNESSKILETSVILKPGKHYRRCLSMLKRNTINIKEPTFCPPDCICLKCRFKKRYSKKSFYIVPKGNILKNRPRHTTILEDYVRRSYCSTGGGYERHNEEEFLIDQQQQQTNLVDENLRKLSIIPRNSLIEQQREKENICLLSPSVLVSAKDVVLQRCGQTQALPFDQCYPKTSLQNCRKIGEGVYGEVFLYKSQNGGTSVMKIIPIEGDLIVNGEPQKKFEEILSEIVIAMELSNLRNGKMNNTSSFSEVQKVRCTQGLYPEKLIELWELYDETRQSENDHPQMFPENQLYIVLELANGGQDLESYVFTNAMQAYTMFQQTACALAVAESELKFEHRDLHWGNILLSNVDKNKMINYRLNNHEIEVRTHGVQVTIIDFTLSRMEFQEIVIFNDLSLDQTLFTAQGDYQFEIYKLMQKANGNKWQHFEPYSNILWLHYILDKAVTSTLRYKNNKTKIHKEYLNKLRKLHKEILTYRSVVQFVEENFI